MQNQETVAWQKLVLVREHRKLTENMFWGKACHFPRFSWNLTLSCFANAASLFWTQVMVLWGAQDRQRQINIQGLQSQNINYFNPFDEGVAQ